MKMNSIKNYFQSPIKENINSTIIENMTAVIKSGKKKRKRIKPKENNETIISDISQTLSSNLHFEKDKNDDLNISDGNIEVNDSEQVQNATDSVCQVKNVFEVMMDARNRVIGSNSNGIVLDIDDVVQDKSPNCVKNKRKLMLEKWCEEKGKNERIAKEQAEIEIINIKMEKRAKRLKNLLTGSSSTNKTDENKSEKRKTKTKLMVQKKLDLEDELENETSPSNKRDMLGYFPKLNGSLEEKNENIRPRRSCTKNKKYIFDISPSKKENSPSPNTTPKKRTKRSLNRSPNAKLKKQKLESDDDVEFVTTELEKPKKPTKVEMKNIKLAPLFVKQVPKPAIDPEVLKARHEFLMSGIPDSLRLEIDRQKIYEDEYELNYCCFPMISHITQLDSSHIQNAVATAKILLIEKTCEEPDIVVNYDKLKIGLVTNCDPNPGVVHSSKFCEPYVIHKIPRKHLITLVNSLRTDCNNYPVYRCYKQLKLKSSQNVHVTNQDDVTVNDGTIQNDENKLYNEKFKPKCLNEIYINYRQGVELKRFLSNWQEDYYSHKLSDESLSNSVSYSNGTSNFVVLIGPYGCGKTNAVYAMAHEMNFKVLEINCGSKRTGKKMLQKLHEATQSHNVHKHTNSQKTDDTDSRSDTDMNTKKLALVLIEDADIVFEQDDGFISAINQLIATSKRPVVLISNNPNSNHLLKFIEQNSIVYYAPSLVNVAKYISLLGLVEHCCLDYGELRKLIQYNQNDLRRTINMVQFFIQSGGDRQTTSKTNKLKSIVSKIPDQFGLSEMLDMDDDNSKLSWCDSDEDKTISKRKSASSSTDVHRHTKVFEFFIRNQNISCKFQFNGNFNNLWFNVPTIFLTKLNNNVKAKKKPNKLDQKKAVNALNQISDFYDSISMALVLDAEKFNQDFSYSCNSSNEIVSTIVEYSMETNKIDYKNYDILLNKNHESLDLLYYSMCSTVASSNSTRVNPTPSVALDYEPYLRTICRVEKDRQHNTDRRSTRFYHYLRNSINTCTFGTEQFDKHTNILNDRFD